VAVDATFVQQRLSSRWLAAALAGIVAIAWVGLMLVALARHDDRSAFAGSQVPPDLAERFYPPPGWAWGLIQTGDGTVQRYGVAGPAGAPRAQVLILPDYGESTETWFDTIRDLNDAGLTVWVLEGVGQGGSARLTSQRDLGEVVSFDADVAAGRNLVDQVIRPDAASPLVMLGEGQGALIAARLAETGGAHAGLIISAPRCAGALADPGVLRGLGMGGLRAPGGSGWTRAGPDDFAAHRTHDPWRGGVTLRWQLANPDLRLGGPSLDWTAAASRLQASAQADAGQITVPTLVVQPAAASTCLSPSNARHMAIAGAGPALELEDDARRGPWLAAVLDFIGSATRSPLSAPHSHGT
jgi:lysophospholipase